MMTSQPQPAWVTDALLGPRQGEEQAPVIPIDPKRPRGDNEKVRTVYFGCLPTTLIQIVHDGFYRELGPGVNLMKEVFGCSVEGVYCNDKIEDALNSIGIPASGGPSGKPGYVGSELISEDGTIPLKIVIRCLADTTGLLWKREERFSRLYCFMPDALFIPMCTLLVSTLTQCGMAQIRSPQGTHTWKPRRGRRQAESRGLTF